jgi:hypothetical protein
MKKIIVFIILLVLLFVVGYLLTKNKTGPINQNPTPVPTSTLIIGGDRDAHGCIGSAGYSWCEPKNKCLRVWEETCYADVGTEIRYLLAKKYNKSIDEVEITISKQDGNYIGGSVLFGEGSPGGGDMFLARKIGNIWEVVFDGNGNVDCNKMRQEYGFPDTILKPSFCD